MCLEIDMAATKAAKQKAKTNNRPVTRYKLLRYDTDNMQLRSQHQPYHWHSGVNESGRDSATLDSYEKTNKSVSYGIHVFISPAWAKENFKCYWNPNMRLVAVRCYPKDLIAVSIKEDKEEVYTRVTMTDRTFKLANKLSVYKKNCIKSRPKKVLAK